MTAQEVYSYLTALPGVGPKSALCVMMCSLNFDVFPVDVNVSRIAVRMGASARQHYHYQALIPPLVPEGRSKRLHVGLVVHGRTVCFPRTPRCDGCLIRDLCKYGRRRQAGAVSASGSSRPNG
jgi:endonuclease III